MKNSDFSAFAASRLRRSIQFPGALDRLRWIESEFSRNRRASHETMAHCEHVLYRIHEGLDESGD